jgi:hypothetical protein
MNWFDAVCHGFFGARARRILDYDASIGHFNSLPIEMVLTVFEILAALNFATHYLAWSQRGVRAYFRDAEAKAIFGVLGASCIGYRAVPVIQGHLPDFGHRAAPCDLQSGFDRDDSGCTPRTIRVADIRADVDDVLELHRREFRLDRRRHQNDPHAGARQTGESGIEPAGASEHGAPAQGGRRRDRQPGGVRGAGVRVPVLHEHRDRWSSCSSRAAWIS